MRLLIGLVSVLVFLVGCATHTSERDARLQQEATTRAVVQQSLQAQVEQLRTRIRATVLPADYREQIDAYFVRTLKDPDSRKIEYNGHPYGSLVCGTINARNAFGGYVGRRPFYAYFDTPGTLGAVETFSEEKLEDLRSLNRSTPLHPDKRIIQGYRLYRDCGGQ